MVSPTGECSAKEVSHWENCSHQAVGLHSILSASMKIINGNCWYFGWCMANTLRLGSIFTSISVYVTERDAWYLYGKELLEYDQYSE